MSVEADNRPAHSSGTVEGAPEEWVILVHGGAGAPDGEVAEVRQRGCNHAAIRGRDLVNRGASALDAAVGIVAVMEDNVDLIAGRGSAANRAGDFEFDASVATGDGVSGAVAAIGPVRNPVLAARLVHTRPEELIVGGGATEMARQAGLAFYTPAELERASRPCR